MLKFLSKSIDRLFCHKSWFNENWITRLFLPFYPNFWWFIKSFAHGPIQCNSTVPLYLKFEVKILVKDHTPCGVGVHEMSLLLIKSYLVKLFTKREGGQKSPKTGSCDLCMAPEPENWWKQKIIFDFRIIFWLKLFL